MRLASLHQWLRLGAVMAMLAGCKAQRPRETPRGGAPDTSFAATQRRGAHVMGVDQYTSAHVFEDLPDGGRIILERDDATDSAGIAAIRAHMRAIASDFRAGDFAKPFAVHAEQVPGTAVMAARHSSISYDPMDRPRGAEVRIRTTDSAAVRAVHEFLAYQRGAHHAAGHEGMSHEP